MSSSQVLIIVIVVLGIIALAAVAWYLMRRRELQQRFGPEYERTVEESDNRLAAEKELRERESRHAELELRELEPEARARYTEQWAQIQTRFVDAPENAVAAADDFVTDRRAGLPDRRLRRAAVTSVRGARPRPQRLPGLTTSTCVISAARRQPSSSGSLCCITAHSSPTCSAMTRPSGRVNRLEPTRLPNWTTSVAKREERPRCVRTVTRWSRRFPRPSGIPAALTAVRIWTRR